MTLKKINNIIIPIIYVAIGKWKNINVINTKIKTEKIIFKIFFWSLPFMKAIKLKPVESHQVVASKCNCGACNCNCGSGSACMNKCMSGETVNYKDELKAVYSK